MTFKEKVSVVVPTYNRRELLILSLKSVCAQTYRPLEVIVVDDGSTDGTVELKGSMIDYGRDNNVEIVWLTQKNFGVSSARNKGLEVSSGEYILFHDSDDLIDPDRICLQVKKLKRTGADLCASSQHRFYPDGHTTKYTPSVQFEDELTPVEIVRMHWGTQMFLYRRSALGVVKWNESLTCAEDIDFNFRVLQNNLHVSLEPNALTLIRETPSPDRLSHAQEGMKLHIEVRTKIMEYYRTKGAEQCLAAAQAILLRTVVTLYKSGLKLEASRLFKKIIPFADGIIQGGIGERFALKIKWCWLFCILRMINNRIGQ